MSEQGSATFNKNILFADNGKVLMGNGIDLALFSDGTHGLVQTQNEIFH